MITLILIFGGIVVAWYGLTKWYDRLKETEVMRLKARLVCLEQSGRFHQAEEVRREIERLTKEPYPT